MPSPLQTAARLREAWRLLAQGGEEAASARGIRQDVGIGMMFIDACAIIAVLSDESEAGRVSDAIASAKTPSPRRLPC